MSEGSRVLQEILLTPHPRPWVPPTSSEKGQPLLQARPAQDSHNVERSLLFWSGALCSGFSLKFPQGVSLISLSPAHGQLMTSMGLDFTNLDMS